MAVLAPIVPYIGLISAAAGVGTAIYAQNKQEEAAEEQAKINALNRKESMDIKEAQFASDRERAKSQQGQKNAGNQAAFEAEMGAMNRAASQEKQRLEQEKALAAKDEEIEYAAKFKAGLERGQDNSGSFLVPKIASDTGLVTNTTSSPGLTTPLTFDV